MTAYRYSTNVRARIQPKLTTRGLWQCEDFTQAKGSHCQNQYSGSTNTESRVDAIRLFDARTVVCVTHLRMTGKVHIKILSSVIDYLWGLLYSTYQKFGFWNLA